MPRFSKKSLPLADENVWSRVTEDAVIDELNRLLQQPEKWSGLSTEWLEVVTWWSCFRYGVTNDVNQVQRLRELYGVYRNRVDPRQRKLLVQRVTESIERGGASLNALMPFIYGDDDIGVVSTAALDIAQVSPLTNNDPMTGPKLLREMAEGSELDHVRAGLLTALLLLDDRRTGSVMHRCWTLLGPFGKEQLAQANSGFMYGIHIDFLVDWLEDADPTTFATLCGVLRRMPSRALQPRVIDVRRAFPGPADGDAIVVEQERTVEEYGLAIERRLIGVLSEFDAMNANSYLSIKAAANELAVSELTVRRGIKEGRIPAVEVGGVWRIPPSYFEQLEFSAYRRISATSIAAAAAVPRPPGRPRVRNLPAWCELRDDPELVVVRPDRPNDRDN